jgi:hypothetical protein
MPNNMQLTFDELISNSLASLKDISQDFDEVMSDDRLTSVVNSSDCCKHFESLDDYLENYRQEEISIFEFMVQQDETSMQFETGKMQMSIPVNEYHADPFVSSIPVHSSLSTASAFSPSSRELSSAQQKPSSIQPRRTIPKIRTRKNLKLPADQREERRRHLNREYQRRHREKRILMEMRFI